MKKLMTMAAVAAMAVSAQAVTIMWGSGGQINVVDGGVPTLMASSSLAGQTAMGLFYLGNTGGTVLTVDDLSAVDALVTSSAVGNKTTTSSTFKAQTYITAISGISAGDVFGVFFINQANNTVSAWFTDATLTTAFNSTYTFTGAETDSTVGVAAYANTTGLSAAVYVPVPEPATAALALAGLAMLIRRRK